ncbi:MAG TPA: hypothetical protein VLK65_12455 [Vicinamibacteria bacterium]|nr:hypothetical protein [Vicinamibacteria bacterium]
MTSLRFTLVLAVLAAPSLAQEPSELVVEPTQLTLEVGETAQLTATVRDEGGNVVDRPVVFYSRQRRSVSVNPTGFVEAYRAGEHVLVCMVPKDPEDLDRRAEALLTVEIPVTIPNPPAASVAFVDVRSIFYEGTVVPLLTEVIDTSGVKRTDIPVRIESSDPTVASIEETGALALHRTGRARLAAHAEDVSGQLDIEVVGNPVDRFELAADADRARTGDVVFFQAKALDERGNAVPDFPVQFATLARAANGIVAPGAMSQIDEEGAFVAERIGFHTVVAVAGSHTAQKTIEIVPRNVRKEIEVVGHGAVRDRHTSDLWVWEAPNGRDYAITGTWGADGHAYFWDVTEPSNIVLVDTVRVDARTVNDVKVSEDGRVAVISREGASNRKNGLVILDVSNPSEGVQVIARYDDQLNGGVHNVFIANGHVYALSNGRRYDIISIEDPKNPYRVGRFELTTPGHGIHDVWIDKGVAYSSNWHDGVVAVDVGGGGQGGAPNHPVQLGSYAYPSGWNHAAFPYRSQSTGRFYVFAGDEAFPYPQDDRPGAPERAAGWIHVIAWDDWKNPREVARYQVPEAGTHNLWIEEDILYIAYYNGGLRVVDVSGELRGDLYKQGREMAYWHPNDPESFKPNAPFAWGPQPYKGHIFIADHHSGLWAVKLVEPKDRFLGEPTN